MFSATDVILCLGSRGSGKTHLSRVVQKHYFRTVVFDPTGEYRDEKDATHIYSFSEFCDELIKIEKLKINKYRIIFHFDPEIADHSELFNEALRLIYYLGNTLIVIEEIQLFSSPHFIPQWLKNCLFVGRHQNLALIFTTQRPGELNKGIFSQCHFIFAGKIIEQNDLKYISNILGPISSKLINIEKRKFILFDGTNSNFLVDNDLKTKVKISSKVLEKVSVTPDHKAD